MNVVEGLDASRLLRMVGCIRGGLGGMKLQDWAGLIGNHLDFRAGIRIEITLTKDLENSDAN